MKNLKQVLALGMAFSLSLSTLASAAFTDQDSISNKNADAVELLTALDVIQGYEDGSFKPEETVTRAQMAKMIYTIRNGGNDNADAYKTVTTSFTDIQGHWAEGYIKYLQNTGIVAGKSATQFEPNSIVTTAEAMKMALVLGGYTPDKAGLTGTQWLNNTISLATTNRLDKDVVSPMAGACTRQDAAQILSNALNMNAVQWSEWTNSFVNDGANGLGMGDKITVGEKWMDLQMETGTLTKVPSGKKNAKGVTFVYTTTDDKGATVSKTVEFKNVTGDYADLLGCEVTVVWNSDNVDSADAIYGIYASSDNVTYETIWKDVSQDGSKVKFGGNSYKLDNTTDGIVVYRDGTEAKTKFTAKDFGGSDLSDEVVFIDNNGDGDIDAAQVNTKSVVEITYVGSSSMTTKEFADKRTEINGSKYDTTPSLDDVNVYDGIAKGDFAVVSYDKYTDKVTYEKVDVKTATIEATRTKGTTTQEIKVDGKWLKAAAGYSGLANLSAATGDTVEYVEVNGLIYNIKKTDGKWGSKSIAMIYNVDTATGEFTNNEIKVQYILRDGTKKTAKLKEIRSADDSKISISGVGDVEKYLGVPMSYTGTDEVTFRLLEDGKNMAGFNAIGTSKTHYEATKDRYNNVEIADDAVVFVYGDNDTTGNASNNLKDNNAKVITGYELKNAGLTNSDSFTLLDGSNGDKYATSKVDGFNYVYMMSVKMKNSDNIETRGKNYGYLTANAYEASIDGKAYRAFDLWTKDGAVTVYEDTDATYTYETGDVITYEVASTKDDKTFIKSVDTAESKLVLGKITAVGTEDFVGIDENKYDITKDTIILNVNTKTNEGIEGDARQGIKETGKKNVRYYVSNGDVVFMLVDSVNDEIMSEEEVSTEDALKNALKNSNYVRVTGNLEIETKKLTVEEGQELVVDGDLTISKSAVRDLASSFVVNGKLTVTGKLTIADGAAVEVGKNANVRAKSIDTREAGLVGDGAAKNVFEGNDKDPYKPVDKDTEGKKVSK